MNGIASKIFDWVDERAGLRELQAKMLNEPVQGGSRYAYVFGSILVYIFVMQIVTGILLMFYYAPTADHAYESTQYIIHEVEYGWFILSYHFWASSVMIVMVVMHMSQVFLWGAYKKPREMVWLAGIVLFLLVFAMGFTGYLLPWDQRSYWATTVGIEIAIIIITAATIGSTASYFLISEWLNNFAYTITLNPLAFVSATILVYAIVFFITGTQSLNSANNNPVLALKQE